MAPLNSFGGAILNINYGWLSVYRGHIREGEIHEFPADDKPTALE